MKQGKQRARKYSAKLAWFCSVYRTRAKV